MTALTAPTVKQNLQSFAERLRTAISRKQCTLREVGDAVDMSTSAVGAWTQGKNWPEVEALAKLASFLGVSTDFLISGTPPTPDLVADRPPASNRGRVVEKRRWLRARFEIAVSLAAENEDRIAWLNHQIVGWLKPPAHWLDGGNPEAERACGILFRTAEPPAAEEVPVVLALAPWRKRVHSAPGDGEALP